MSQFNDKSIKEVVEDLNIRYFLPDIQREYVWLSRPKDEKIENLFDSILRGYPIGTFLFWELSKDDLESNKNVAKNTEKLNFQLYKFIENFDIRNQQNEKIDIDKINKNDLTIVLDGQQRLTSLYVGLKGSRTLRRRHAKSGSANEYEEKKLFLNLRHTPIDEDPDQDSYEFLFKREGDDLTADKNHYWFKVADILTLPSVVAYARENNLSDDEAKILEKLTQVCCSDRCISYFKETDKNLDKVLRIFIRVNSGGTQLSYSDILMSILTANFSTDIRSRMSDFVKLIKEERFGIMGRDQILKTCLLLTKCDTKFALKNFNKKNIHEIEKNWNEITSTIIRAAELLRDFGYRDMLSSAYILSVVALYLFDRPKVGGEDLKELHKFVRNAQITGYFSASLDTKLAVMKNACLNVERFIDVNSALASNPSAPLKISSDDVERMMERGYGQSAVFPILQALYSDIDFTTYKFHIDHIYPKSKFNEKNKRIPPTHYGNSNLLYNLQLLKGGENLSKRDKDPEDWLGEKYRNDKEKIRAYKERNYISADFDLQWENIAKFELARREKMLRKLKSIFLAD